MVSYNDLFRLLLGIAWMLPIDDNLLLGITTSTGMNLDSTESKNKNVGN